MDNIESQWTVEIKTEHGDWMKHSMGESYEEAVIQAGIVRGRIRCPTGLLDTDAWRWAQHNQGFTGTYEQWKELSDEVRQQYEDGAAGIGTV